MVKDMNTIWTYSARGIRAGITAIAIVGCVVMMGGCGNSGGGNSPTAAPATVDGKIQQIEQSTMSEQNKQTAIAMVKAHFGQPSSAPTAPTQ
jgi:hypothetical protein